MSTLEIMLTIFFLTSILLDLIIILFRLFQKTETVVKTDDISDTIQERVDRLERYHNKALALYKKSIKLNQERFKIMEERLHDLEKEEGFLIAHNSDSEDNEDNEDAISVPAY